MKQFNVLCEGHGATAMYVAEDLKDCGVDVQDIEKSVISVGGLAELILVLKCESSEKTFKNVRDKFGYRQVNFQGVSLM